MLSECCLQRQHSDKISVFDLFQRPKTLISSQKKAKNTSFARMLSQCCLNVVSRDNIQTTFAFCLKILGMFAPRSQSCLNVVSRDNIQTTFARNNFCERSWICLQLAAKVVWMLSPETTFRQHLGSIQITLTRNIFWKTLGMFATHSRCCLTVLCR